MSSQKRARGQRDSPVATRTRKKAQNKSGDDDEEPSVNQQILEALQTQNTLLQTQNTLLRSVDGRLGRIEQQEQGNNLIRGPSNRLTVAGSWKFAESPEAARKREQWRKKRQDINRELPFGSYGRIIGDGLTLEGDESFPLQGNGSASMYHPSIDMQSIYPYMPFEHPHRPKWSEEWGEGGRQLLPQLVFNSEATLRQKTGIYSLAVKFNKAVAGDVQATANAGIIIGEMEFNDNGYVLAEGADWDWLLNNKRQTKLPYANGARGIPTWSLRKLTEPWEDGDVLKFRIDTNENTIVYQRGNGHEKTFWNVLAFTNNRKYPDFLHVFAYAGSLRSLSRNPNVSLTIM